MIKSKFSQCISCPLKDQGMVLGETNSPDNLQNIDLLVLAEAPAATEVDLGRPLMGKAGKIFRRIFKLSKLEELSHYIGNIVFCSNLYIDEVTGKRKTNNPPKLAIELCKPNWKTLIKVIEPRYILALGANVKGLMGIFGSMEENRGNFYKLNGEKLNLSYDPEVFVTYHPSFIGRGVATSKQINDFENDFKLLYSTITGGSVEEQELKINRDKLKLKTPYFYPIPSWMKTDDTMLVDIQSPPSSNEVIYIFRDTKGKRRYHFDDSGDYYYYRGDGVLQNSPVLNRIEDVELIQGQCLDSHTAPLYEGDVKIEMKHSIDYYMQRKIPEPDVPLKKMFFDIEVYSYGDKAFPEPKLAKSPVNAISFKIDDGDLNVFMVNPYKLLKNPDESKHNITEEDISEMNLNFNVRIFQSEKALLTAFAREVAKSEVDIVTGWNCINKNENVWLEDRILTISDCNNTHKLSNHYGKINKYKDTGIKDGFEICLKGGFKIISSNEHVFPVYIKKKCEYKNSNTIINTEQNLTVNELIELYKENDIYFRVERHENKNPKYTYREYLLENIEHILSFDEIDILIRDPSILDKLKNNIKVRKIIGIDRYWNKKDFFMRNSRWTFKNLMEFLNMEDIIKQIKKYDKQYFIVKGNGKNRVEIDINENIELEDLQLLGLQYSDGFWSKSKSDYNEHHFTNKNVKLTEYYVNLCNRYRRSKIENINKKFSRGVFDFEFGFVNKYTLLIPIIYNSNRKKSLLIRILSRLSKEQFYSFISGIIDGDGCILPTGIDVCNFENGGKDISILHQLILWNNIFSYKTKNRIYIPKYEENLEFFNNLKIKQSERKYRLERVKTIVKKNRPSKKLDKYIFDKFLIIKLKQINKLKKYDMCDIETSTHFFICNGIKTHNCIGFDIPTINNRMKKLGIDPNILSPLGKTFVNPYKYGDIFIGGLYALDMFETYKGLTENKKESNKLGAISKLELGKEKVEYEGSLDDVYENDIKKFIRYSGQDTRLVHELDKKLGHIKLLKSMKEICHTTWKGTETTTGLLDPLLISFAKDRGMVMRNAEGAKKEKYPGAYVVTPKMGLYSWLVDLDYTSLYPSIIISFNIGPETLIGKIDPVIAKNFIYRPERLPEKIRVITNPMMSEEFQVYKDMTKEEFTNWVYENDGIMNVAGTIFIGHSKKQSFVAEVNQLLLDTRVVFKDKMKETRKLGDQIWKVHYNTQWAYKILANSIYGFMGLSSSRLFKTDLARSITLPGQELIKFAGTHLTKYMETGSKDINPDFIDEFDNLGKKYLIYGDTDSIFLNMSEYLMDKNLL